MSSFPLTASTASTAVTDTSNVAVLPNRPPHTDGDATSKVVGERSQMAAIGMPIFTGARIPASHSDFKAAPQASTHPSSLHAITQDLLSDVQELKTAMRALKDNTVNAALQPARIALDHLSRMKQGLQQLMELSFVLRDALRVHPLERLLNKLQAALDRLDSAGLTGMQELERRLNELEALIEKLEVKVRQLSPELKQLVNNPVQRQRLTAAAA